MAEKKPSASQHPEPAPRKGRALLKRLQRDVHDGPVRTLAQHALGVMVAPVTADGDIALPVPHAMRADRTIPPLMMMRTPALYLPDRRPPLPLDPVFLPKNKADKQAVVFWLGEEALGERFHTVKSRALSPQQKAKIEERAQELVVAMRQEYGLTDRELTVRVSIPNDAFRLQSRACAAIALVVAPRYTAMVELIRDDLYAGQHRARLMEKQPRKHSIGAHIPAAPSTEPVITTEPRALKIPHNPKPLLLPAPAATPTLPNAVQALLNDTIGRMEVHAINPDGTIHIEAMSPAKKYLGEVYGIDMRQNNAVSPETNCILTLWLDRLDAKLCAETLSDPQTSPAEREQATRYMRDLYTPLNAYINAQYGVDCGFNCIRMPSLAQPLLLIAEVNAGANQLTMLKDLHGKLGALRRAPAIPEPTPPTPAFLEGAPSFAERFSAHKTRHESRATLAMRDFMQYHAPGLPLEKVRIRSGGEVSMHLSKGPAAQLTGQRRVLHCSIRSKRLNHHTETHDTNALCLWMRPGFRAEEGKGTSPGAKDKLQELADALRANYNIPLLVTACNPDPRMLPRSPLVAPTMVVISTDKSNPAFQRVLITRIRDDLAAQLREQREDPHRKDLDHRPRPPTIMR